MAEERMSNCEEEVTMEIHSPGKATRLHEKEQLQDLNGRLAVFMDRIQFVREQNDDLRLELERCKDTHRREMSSHRSLFEKELSEARKLLDETAREKAKFELAASRNSALSADAKHKLEQETTNRVELEKRLQSDKRELQQCHIQMDEYVKEQKKLEERILQMDTDVAAYQEQSETDRTKLEAEMVARVNAENNCQSLHEEISFNFTVHVKEKDDLCNRLVILERDYDDLRNSFEKELELRVSQTLAVARDEQELESDRIRDELDQLYGSKLKEVTDRHERDSSTLASLSEVNTTLSDQNRLLSEDNASLTAKVAQLSKQLDNREYERLRDREHYRLENEHLQKELEVLQQELSSKLTEFADLMDVNIRLDKEISLYHRLLREQERKVGLGSDDFPSSLPRSGQKTSAAKLYASPLTRPIPPPLSSIPRKEPLLLEMPPPLPPRHYTTDEEQTEDSRDSAGSAASSFISFLTGIGRKRQHTVPSVSTGEAVESTAERATNTLSEATDTGEDFSFENSVAYGIRLEIGHDGDFVRLINLQDDAIPLVGWKLEKQTSGKPLLYRFNKTAVLKTGAVITVWSHGSGHSSQPPTDYVSRHVTSWASDDTPLQLSLYDSEAMVRAMSSPDAPSDLTGQTSAPSKKRCDRRSTISAYNEAALGIAVTCGTPQSDVSTDVDTSEVDTGGAASGHSSGQKSSKVSRSKSSKLRSRSKSPGRRTLAKSLSSVAIDRFQVDVSKEKSLTSSNVPATADASLNTTKPEAQRSTSNNTTKLSSKSSTSRKNQAAATPASSSNAEQGLNSFAVSSSIASNDSSNLTDVANVIANNEEIFHEQGDPGRENCVIC